MKSIIVLVMLWIFLLKFKGDERKVENRNIEYNLQFNAQNGSGFGTWIIINNLSCDKHIVNIFKNGKGIVELKVFNGYVQNNKNKFLSISVLDVV